MIEWKDEYNVGEEVIDAQHQKLVGLISGCASHPEGTVSVAFCKASLHKILGFLIEHAEYEEHYIQSKNYPFYEQSKSVHKKLINELEEILNEVNMSNEELHGHVREKVDVWWGHYVRDELELFKGALLNVKK